MTDQSALPGSRPEAMIAVRQYSDFWRLLPTARADGSGECLSLKWGAVEPLRSLKPFPKIFDNYIADQCGNDGNNKIGDCENVSKGKKQALAVFSIRMLKFAHQEIRIKQKDYESDLNQCSPDRSQPVHAYPLCSRLEPLPIPPTPSQYHQSPKVGQ